MKSIIDFVDNVFTKKKVFTNIEEYFQWIKDNCCEIDENGCWNYTRALTRSGYGICQFRGKMYKLHRLSYEIHNEITLPPFNHHTKSSVLHKCDNRKCFNPKCLYLGDVFDNMRDRKNTGNYDGDKIKQSIRRNESAFLKSFL